MNKKTLLTVIVVVLVAAAVYFLFIKGDGGLIGQKISQNARPKPSFEVTKTDVSPSEKPSGFPASVSIEKGATITQNYEADTTDGRHQSTRVFESSKTVAQNYKIYMDSLSQNGWTIKNKLQTDNLASIFASKQGFDLSVTISKNSITGKVTVSLSAVTTK